MTVTVQTPLISDDWRISGRVYRDQDLFEAEMRRSESVV